MMDMEGNNPDYYEAVGAILLRCSNSGCCESVVCVGTITKTQTGEPWGSESHYEDQIDPHYFLPPIHIISVPNDLPKPILNSLTESLNLFWINPSASGNALRILVEVLMDHERVVKSFRDKRGIRRMYTLHQRIDLYKAKNSDLGSKLLAIKWIGNSGSHITGLTRDQLIKAYRILEYVLEERFDEKSKKLTRLVNQINRKRGRI